MTHFRKLCSFVLLSTLFACGQGNSVTDDSDADGVPDLIDAFPNNAAETIDTDFDGTGDNEDNDDDNDSFDDSVDLFPLNPYEWADADLDGIGDNSDLDDDNDGVEDSIDAFPTDPNETLDFDNDGLGNNADTDDDNDGVIDTDDAFPLDASEFSDFDNDNIGDHADQDDDNDGVQDSVDNIHLVGNKEQYQQNEFISVEVRGFNVENQLLNANNGWHLQYQVFNAETNQGITSLSTDGYYNGQWDSLSQSWRIFFPAPDYQITYDARITVYCSLHDNDCDGIENNNYTAQDNFQFTVYCEQETSCIETNQAHKATQLTNSQSSQDSPVIQRRNDGQLFVVYRDFDNLSAQPLLESADSGETWNTATNLPESYNESFLITDADEFIVFQHCDLSICMYKKDSDGVETYLSLEALLSDAGIDIPMLTDDEGPGYPFANFEIIQTRDDGFIIGFSVQQTLDGRLTNLYLVKTFDFISATSSTQLNTAEGLHGHLSIAEASEGLTVSYSRVDDNHQRKWIVKRGNHLETLSQAANTDNLFQDLDLIVMGDETKIISNSSGSLYQMALQNDTLEFAELLYNDGVMLGFSGIALSEDTIAVVYAADWNEQRDIFMDIIRLD